MQCLGNAISRQNSCLQRNFVQYTIQIRIYIPKMIAQNIQIRMRIVSSQTDKNEQVRACLSSPAAHHSSCQSSIVRLSALGCIVSVKTITLSKLEDLSSEHTKFVTSCPVIPRMILKRTTVFYVWPLACYDNTWVPQHHWSLWRHRYFI